MQHLVSSSKNASRKKWLLWGGAGAVVVIVVVVLVVVFAVNKDDDPVDPVDPDGGTRVPLSLENILTGEVSARSFNGTFISPNHVMFRNSEGKVTIYNVANGESQNLITNEDVVEGAVDFWFSPDQRFVLISREYQKVFRHSFTALYDIVNLEDSTVTPVRVGTSGTRLIFAQWNPVTNGLIFVYNNNIYYKTTPTADPVQVTRDPATYPIFNGIPDWVYEEEIVSDNSAIWFSPDGTKFAFARYDDTPVRAMNLPIYGVPGSIDFQYTQLLGINYPKAGTPNPTVTLHSVAIADLATINNHLYQGVEPKPILATVNWVDDTRIVAIWTNRVQNEAQIHVCGTTCAVVSLKC